ncbi:MAG: Serine phosphatase RsbU, regulator of sigma subunit [Candidatus Angelobacter sp.]|nr:Serine phosphatase RsbU, regulator of sigma subunit [Candidatus Angelobacter sp.]
MASAFLPVLMPTRTYNHAMSSPPSTGTEFTHPLDQRDLYLGIQAVDVFVRDLEQSLQFYVNQLGFKLVSDVILQSGRRRLGVSPPNGTAVLNLIAPDPDSDEYKLIGRSTQVVFVTEDVAAQYRDWRKRGVRFHHTPRLRRIKYLQQAPARVAEQTLLFGDQPPVWGGVFTRFEDLDHNSFALVSLDEISRTIEQQRRAMAAKLESERRAAHELEIAKQVQARLFPQALPEVQTLEYAGICIQAREVGGDYYDFLSLGGDCLGVALADISGKGIAAALIMANLQANLRTQSAIAWDEPQKFLKSVNHLFYENTAENVYASLFFGAYDDHARHLRYANCGHLCALLLRSDGGLERLDSTCTVMGLFQDWECTMAECSLFAGDTFALYTDGVTEAFNDAGEEFGEQRLIDALRQNRGLSPQNLLNLIIEEVRRFSAREQHDDITLIVARCRES